MLLSPKFINTNSLNHIRRHFINKSYNLYCKTNQVISNNDIDNNQFTSIYKTSHVPFFVGLNRFKKIQAIAFSCLIPSSLSLKALGYLNIEEVICASLIGFGLTVGLHIVSWLLSNNLVVFVYLSKDEKICRMSYISYWGNRKELYCNIIDIEPIKSSKFDFLNYKIKIEGNNNKFKITINNAIIFNNAKFRKIFGSDIM